MSCIPIAGFSGCFDVGNILRVLITFALVDVVVGAECDVAVSLTYRQSQWCHGREIGSYSLSSAICREYRRFRILRYLMGDS
jgi:hypothetical protein